MVLNVQQVQNDSLAYSEEKSFAENSWFACLPVGM